MSDISAELQARCRAFVQREFERVGDSQPIAIDGNIVAAINKYRDETVNRGSLRADLCLVSMSSRLLRRFSRRFSGFTRIKRSVDND
jgi:DNA-binding NtrC family response regulator